MLFEGAGFFLRPKRRRRSGLAGLSSLTWGNFLTCHRPRGGDRGGLLGRGAARRALRLADLGRFPVRASYGKNQLTGPLLTGIFLDERLTDFEIDTSDTDFADIAVFYTADWNSIKLSAAAAYTWIETSVATVVSRGRLSR